VTPLFLLSSSSVFTEEPTEIFSNLVNAAAAAAAADASTCSNNTLLDLKQIRDGWIELQELMEDGDLLSSELDDLFALALLQMRGREQGTTTTTTTTSSSAGVDQLDEHGFVLLYTAIDSLFEVVAADDVVMDPVDDNNNNNNNNNNNKVDDDDDATEIDDEIMNKKVVAAAAAAGISPIEITFDQQPLLSFLADHAVTCGFECTDKEREQIHAMIMDLELDHANLAQLNNGKIDAKRFLGNWEMLYTTSRTMIINKSLSGLGRSTSTLAPFVKLVHRMTGSKFLGKCEYVETFGTGPESFDVTVTGEWMLKNGVNPFNGKANTVLWVDPDKIMYGFSTNDADDWASLGPIKRMDIVYMKDDLLITRGNVNTESIFVYRRIND
jgi:ABC-type transporter Mla MlaB component